MQHQNIETQEYAKKVLARYAGNEKVAELYDDDEDFANAIRDLAGPEFEYPEFSYLTVAEATKKAEAMGRAVQREVSPVVTPAQLASLNSALAVYKDVVTALQAKFGMLDGRLERNGDVVAITPEQNLYRFNLVDDGGNLLDEDCIHFIVDGACGYRAIRNPESSTASSITGHLSELV